MAKRSKANVLNLVYSLYKIINYVNTALNLYDFWFLSN